MAARAQAHIVVAIAVVLLAAAPASEAAIACYQVASAIGSCFSYACGTGSGPSEWCCRGLRDLNAAATTAAARRAACDCLRYFTAELSCGSGVAINAADAAGIPARCGVSMPYTFNATADCSTLQVWVS